MKIYKVIRVFSKDIQEVIDIEVDLYQKKFISVDKKVGVICRLEQI